MPIFNVMSSFLVKLYWIEFYFCYHVIAVEKFIAFQ